MQYKILASDYDNTLVPFGESQPRPAMVKAVKKLQAAGGKFVLSTGRAWSAINRKGPAGRHPVRLCHHLQRCLRRGQERCHRGRAPHDQ